MAILLSIINGAVVAVMILLNGELSGVYGNYYATAIIHIVGLAGTILVLLYKRYSPVPKVRIPWYWYTGGLIGIMTVIFNNLTYAGLGVSATLALGLLGQTLASLAVDQWGLLGSKKSRINKKKLIGLSAVVLGIVVMLI